MNINAIITADGQRLAAFPYPAEVWSESPRIEWRGAVYPQHHYVAEWMELLDESGELVGIQLDLARDLHPPFWQWLHRFPNVTFDEHGGAQIHFQQSDGTERTGGPFLPVEAFTTDGGDFVLHVPELFCAA